MSTILDSCAIFLNAAADLTDYMAFDMVTQIQASQTKDARVSTLANGRERLLVRAGGRQAASLRFEFCTREQVEWIEAHEAVLLCYRDHTSRKFYGMFTSPQIDEDVWPGTDRANVSLSFRQVTHSEAVA